MQIREGIWLAIQAIGVLVGTTVVVLAAFFGLFVGSMYYLLSSDCIPEIDRSIRSPDGQFAAVVYMSHCGTLASDTTSVSIDPRTRRFSPEKSNPFFVIKDDPDFTVRWTDERTIEIVVPKDKHVYKQEQATDGIKVDYK